MHSNVVLMLVLHCLIIILHMLPNNFNAPNKPRLNIIFKVTLKIYPRQHSTKTLELVNLVVLFFLVYLINNIFD